MRAVGDGLGFSGGEVQVHGGRAVWFDVNGLAWNQNERLRGTDSTHRKPTLREDALMAPVLLIRVCLEPPHPDVTVPLGKLCDR